MRFKWRRLDQGDVLVLTACAVLVACPFLPSTLNGALYGERRLAALAWPVLCIALAARPMKNFVSARLFAVIGCAMTIVAVLSLRGSLQPASEFMHEMERAPLPAFRTGLVLETDAGLKETLGSGYAVTYWAGARGFAAKHDLLLNSPWLNETHIPIQQHSGITLMNGLVGQHEIDTPIHLYEALIASTSLRREVSRRIDFAVIVDPSANPADKLRAALDHSEIWTCESKSGEYAVCAKSIR